MRSADGCSDDDFKTERHKPIIGFVMALDDLIDEWRAKAPEDRITLAEVCGAIEEQKFRIMLQMHQETIKRYAKDE